METETIHQENNKDKYAFYDFDLNVVEEVLQNPNDSEYTDHFGFKIQVKTDDEYEDDTSVDSENEDKKDNQKFRTKGQNNNAFSSEEEDDDDDTDVDTAITTPTTIKHTHLSVSSLDTEDMLPEQRQESTSQFENEQITTLPTFINQQQQQRRKRSMTVSHHQQTTFNSTSSSSLSSLKKDVSIIKPITTTTNTSPIPTTNTTRRRAMTLISPRPFVHLISSDSDETDDDNKNHRSFYNKKDMCDPNIIPDDFCSTIMRQQNPHHFAVNSDKSPLSSPPIEKPSNIYKNRQSKRISDIQSRNSLSSSSASSIIDSSNNKNGSKRNSLYDKFTNSIHIHSTTTNDRKQSIEDSANQIILKEETSQNLAHLKECSPDNYDWEFWATVINDFDTIKQHKRDLLREHICQGTPPTLRGHIWQIFSKSRNNSEAVELEYRELLKRVSPQEKIIRRDIPRAFPNQPFFKQKDGDGQEMLFNVIKAYSLFDPQVGYCQGLPFVVGCLLLNMPDEAAFCVLINLMTEYGLRGHFTPNMELLHERLYQFDELLRIHLPQIYRHLDAQGVHSTMYASQWFMTLFAYRCSLDLVFRVIDMVFADGSAIVLNVGLALMKKNQPTILSLEFEGLLAFLGSEIFDVYKDNASQFVKDTYEFNIPQKELAKLTKRHLVKAAHDAKIQGKEDSLRQENHELTQRARKLEKSYKALEKEHEELATKVIASKMERARASDDNEQLQHTIAQLEHSIKKTKENMENEKQEEFNRLAHENNQLVQRNAQLEDHLAEIEATLIEFKLKYACSENEYEQMKNKLGQIKKISG